jgi:hypothetical protein
MILMMILFLPPQRGRDLDSQTSKQASFITYSFLDTPRTRASVCEMEIKKRAS